MVNVGHEMQKRGQREWGRVSPVEVSNLGLPCSRRVLFPLSYPAVLVGGIINSNIFRRLNPVYTFNQKIRWRNEVTYLLLLESDAPWVPVASSRKPFSWHRHTPLGTALPSGNDGMASGQLRGTAEGGQWAKLRRVASCLPHTEGSPLARLLIIMIWHGKEWCQSI